MEIKTRRINTKSPKKHKSKSIDRYEEFLGTKKNIESSKDKKVFHVTRKRVSPKKVKKVLNPKDLLKIENEISNMRISNLYIYNIYLTKKKKIRVKLIPKRLEKNY